MNDGLRDILVLVEGEKTDVRLMEKLFHIYGISERHRIVSYNTNIYALYNSMFANADPDDLDILLHLKSRETDPEQKAIFDRRYAEILLIFDFEPHAPDFTETKILEMVNFFTESTEMGKLYLNYPMVESFYHMKSIPDANYHSYVTTMTELTSNHYKTRVNKESRGRDYTKFAANKVECNIVIQQNADKANTLVGRVPGAYFNLPDLREVLNVQLRKVSDEQSVAVLCTCVFYIIEYNPEFLTHEQIRVP